MSYYEKLGWKLGKGNEIFLKKGPEKLFFELLEKFNSKYVEAFKELLKYINKNSIVNFIPHFFPDGQNKDIQTYDDLMEYAGKYDKVTLMEIIEISPPDKEKLLDFDEAIVEKGICLKSNLTMTSLNMTKILVNEDEEYELEFVSNENKYISYEKEYYNCFDVGYERKEEKIVLLDSYDIFETINYEKFDCYETKQIPFDFFNQHPIVAFVITELLKEENYLFKDFSEEMKQILNKETNINFFFEYFNIRGEINKLKEINSKKEYFVKFLKEKKWNKYRNKISFALNLLLFRTPRFINEYVPLFMNENVLRETMEKEDRIIKNFIMNYEKFGEEHFQSQFLFGIIFLLERIEINSEKIPEVTALMQDTFLMARELEIPVDLTKINSEKALKKKHDKFSEEIKLRARLREKEKLETVFEFPEKFSPVIENLGTEYELIRDGKRLLEEGEEQRNCVFSYFKNITEGKCLIYSLLTETEKSSEDISGNSGKERKRYTIEIIERNGKFEVDQFLGKFNKKTSVSIKLEAELREKLKNIRAKTENI